MTILCLTDVVTTTPRGTAAELLTKREIWGVAGGGGAWREKGNFPRHVESNSLLRQTAAI